MQAGRRIIYIKHTHKHTHTHTSTHTHAKTHMYGISEDAICMYYIHTHIIHTLLSTEMVHGVRSGWEEYFDYIFPDEAKPQVACLSVAAFLSLSVSLYRSLILGCRQSELTHKHPTQALKILEMAQKWKKQKTDEA